MPPNFHQTPHGDRGCSRLQESQYPCGRPVIFQCWTQSGTLGHVGQTSRFYLWEVSIAQNDPGTWCVSWVSEGRRKAWAGETSSPVREVCLGTQA